MQPIKLEIFLDDKTLAGMKSVEGNMAAMESVTRQVMDHLKLQLKDLEKQYKVLQSQGIAGDKEMADIQALQGAIGGLKDRLKEYEAAKKQASETPIMQNDPAPKLNSVKMSMQQIARELPALAMGPQMFFLAISNNIPMFTDAVGNARKEYERLTAAGQKATPVWRQLLKSLISWQTAMATVITLTVVYGKEIGEFFRQLSKGKKVALEMAKAQEKVNEAMDAADLGKKIVSIRSLQDRWNQLGDSLAEKKKFIKDNKDEFDKLGVSVSNVDEAENALVSKTELFIQAMTLRAEAAAAFKLASEEAEKALKSQIEIDKKKKKGPSFFDKAISFLVLDPKWMLGSLSGKQGTSRAETVWNADINNQEDIKKTAEDDAEAYTKTYNAKLLESAKKLKEAGIKEKTEDKDSKTDKRDYSSELADARVRAQQKIEAARIAMMQEGYEKRKAITRKEYTDSLAAIDKEERDTLAKMEKSKKSGKKVAPEEEQQVKNDAQTQRTLAQVLYMQGIYNIEKEWREKSQQAWIDYNKEYGSYQAKRLAIAQDYALKIGKAENSGERASLARKRDDDLKELDFSEFKKSINFADVFGNLDEQSTDALSTLRDKLKEYINGAAGKLRPSDLKELQNALANIDLKLSDRKPFQELKMSMDDYKSACKGVEEAQAALTLAQKEGYAVTARIDEKTGETVYTYLTLEQAEKNLTDAQKKRQQSQAQFARSLQGVAGKMASYGQAANDVINVLEGFGVEVDENVKRVVEGFNAMSDGISQFAQSLMSMDIGGMISGIVNTMGGAVNMIGSLFGADWGGERSTRRYEQAKEKYESYMDVLDKVIAKQKELVASMEADDFANADNSYEKARDLLKKQEDYAREMGKAYLNSGASKGFLGIGSSASKGTKQREGISQSAWTQAKKVLGSDYNKVADGRMTGLFDLSYEKLVKLRDEASGFWSELHEDTRNYLEQIIESEEAWQEVQDARKEALTKTDFDSFYSGFISMLSDMDATSEDFADSFEKYLQNAIFSALVASRYKTRIENLYNSWADMAQSDKKLSDEEADALRRDYERIVKDMLAERERVMKDFGWSASSEEGSTQSGRSGAFTTMSQEQGTKLEGLFTSLQDHASGMHRLLEDLKKGRDADHELFMRIAENTEYCRLLEDILDILASKDRDGWKMT